MRIVNIIFIILIIVLCTLFVLYAYPKNIINDRRLILFILPFTFEKNNVMEKSFLHGIYTGLTENSYVTVYARQPQSFKETLSLTDKKNIYKNISDTTQLTINSFQNSISSYLTSLNNVSDNILDNNDVLDYMYKTIKYSFQTLDSFIKRDYYKYFELYSMSMQFNPDLKELYYITYKVPSGINQRDVTNKYNDYEQTPQFIQFTDENISTGALNTNASRYNVLNKFMIHYYAPINIKVNGKIQTLGIFDVSFIIRYQDFEQVINNALKESGNRKALVYTWAETKEEYNAILNVKENNPQHIYYLIQHGIQYENVIPYMGTNWNTIGKDIANKLYSYTTDAMYILILRTPNITYGKDLMVNNLKNHMNELNASTLVQSIKLYSDPNSNTIVEEIKNLIMRNQYISFILVDDDGLNKPLIQALEEVDREPHIKFITWDDQDKYNNIPGFEFSINTDPYMLGYQAVNKGVDKLSGMDKTNNSIYIPIEL